MQSVNVDIVWYVVAVSFVAAYTSSWVTCSISAWTAADV